MILNNSDSWNIRDEHMVETLNYLYNFHGKDAKAIVWEHNTHIGDARATGMARAGMVNVGELVRRERGPKDVVLAGFGSYEGSVIAGRHWGALMEKMRVPLAKENSWEDMLHDISPENKLLIFDELKDKQLLGHAIGHRAIGVVYDPGRDEYANYVPSLMAARYDAFMYIDKTKALHAVSGDAGHADAPDLYPWGV
jgi:erythromycin esterase-like protein